MNADDFMMNYIPTPPDVVWTDMMLAIQRSCPYSPVGDMVARANAVVAEYRKQFMPEPEQAQADVLPFLLRDDALNKQTNDVQGE